MTTTSAFDSKPGDRTSLQVSVDLHGKTAGIVGTGKIGRVAAEILRGLGMKVWACDPFPCSWRNHQLLSGCADDQDAGASVGDVIAP